MRNPLVIAALAAVVLLAVFLVAQRASQVSVIDGDTINVESQRPSQVRVIDGDTIDVEGQRIRIHGIDAPEAKQTCRRDNGPWACGQDASRYMQELVRGEAISCDALDKDRYGRTIGRCWVNGTDVGASMVSAGYALAYRRYSQDYVAQEAVARRSKAGLWAGKFVPPWEWRRGVRLAK